MSPSSRRIVPSAASSRPADACGVERSALGTIRRDDGDLQVTYHGRPLYYYAADASTPGKAKGEDVEQFGASWYLVDGAGKPIEPESGSNAPGSNNGGGGY